MDFQELSGTLFRVAQNILALATIDMKFVAQQFSATSFRTLASNKLILTRCLFFSLSYVLYMSKHMSKRLLFTYIHFCLPMGYIYGRLKLGDDTWFAVWRQTCMKSAPLDLTN